MSQSKVSRIETGRLLPSVVDVEQMLTALGVDPAIQRELLALARVANAEYHNVRASVRRGLHHRQRELAALESNATQVRHFLPALVTGLLQIPEYMHAAMNTPIEPATTDSTRAIALKLERQVVLYDKTKHFEFLLTESAVRWQLCAPSIMAVQIDRLISLSWLPNIRIGILPLSAHVPDGAYHTFVTYDRRLVTVELFTGQLVLRDPKDIDHYRALFDFFTSHALWPQGARSFLRELADTFRTSKQFEHVHSPGAVPIVPITSRYAHSDTGPTTTRTTAQLTALGPHRTGRGDADEATKRRETIPWERCPVCGYRAIPRDGLLIHEIASPIPRHPLQLRQPLNVAVPLRG